MVAAVPLHKEIAMIDMQYFVEHPGAYAYAILACAIVGALFGMLIGIMVH